MEYEQRQSQRLKWCESVFVALRPNKHRVQRVRSCDIGGLHARYMKYIDSHVQVSLEEYQLCLAGITAIWEETPIWRPPAGSSIQYRAACVSRRSAYVTLRILDRGYQYTVLLPP